MAKQKLRIVIKDLPKDMLISDAEKKKIIGGTFFPMGYMNAAPIITPPISPPLYKPCKLFLKKR